MGTSGAYTGAGGKAGKEVSQGLAEWVDSLPGAPSGADGEETVGSPDDGDRPTISLPTEAITGLLGLLRPRTSGSGSADGPGGGGFGGGGVESGGRGKTRAGSGRSTRRLSSIGGRAAAGAYAFARADASGLQGLGLDYGELAALGDPFEVTRLIVDAVCGERAESTLESEEERYVAAAIADWVLTESEEGPPPELDEVTRYAIATILG